MSLLYRLLPDHRQSILDERWMILMTTAVHTLSRYQTARQSGDLPAPFHELLDDLVDFLTGGIESMSPRECPTGSDTGLALAAEGGSVSTTDHDQAGPSHAVEDHPEATSGMPVASIVRLAGPAPAPDRR
ncbi:hypothetical protein AB1484_09865 [Parafrankia sp. FMc6]|uniref:hypothetical protein n=1 Tax=Parafrankia soli TaxID=2599596 RepID=UPI0034D69016